MGLLDYAVDDDATHTIEFDDSTIDVKSVNMNEALRYVEDNMPPLVEDEDEEQQEKRKAMRNELLNRYVAEFAVVGWSDPDLEFSTENAVKLLTSPNFSRIAAICLQQALKGENFKLSKADAVKKHVFELSEGSSIGSENTLAKTSA